MRRWIRVWISLDVRDPGTDLHDGAGRLYDPVLTFFPLALRRITGRWITKRVAGIPPPRFYVIAYIPPLAPTQTGLSRSQSMSG